MIVQCPECTTKYNLDESKIGHDGSKVRCSRCKNVFTVFKPMETGAAAVQAEVPRSAPALDDLEDDLAALTGGAPAPAASAQPEPRPALDDLEEDLAALMGESQQSPAARPEASRPAPAADDFEDELAMLLGDDSSAPAAKPAASRPTSAADDFEDDLEAMLGNGASAAAKPARPASGPVLDDLEDDLNAMMDSAKPSAEQPAAKPAPRSASSVDEDMIADLQGAFQQPLLGGKGKDPLQDDEPAPKPKKSGKLGLVLGLVLFLLAAGGGAVYFLQPGLLGLGSHGGKEQTQEAGAPREGAAQIALENVRQYFVPNEKEGQLFIIEGKAVNRFAEPRELIRLKASLFDKQGGEVAAQEFMCGNVVSLYQLQVSSKADIESALTAKVGILTNNTNIQPGASVPFMAVFFKTPETVEEFGLEVIQSTAPQQ